MGAGRGLLRLERLTKAFGGLIAVSGVSFDVHEGELAGLIGPNGAGKTTVFNLISGLLRPTAGSIVLDGRVICNMRPDAIASLGISRTYQNNRLFKRLTALDNLATAYHMKYNYSLSDALLGLPKFHATERRVRDEAMEWLGFFGLHDCADKLAGSLAYGHQRRLEIARALVPGPRLLLLDEPAAGMNPSEKAELLELIQRIRHDFHLTILLVEHDMKVVMSLCDTVNVLNKGELIASSCPEDIQNDQDVIQAYLGTKYAKARSNGGTACERGQAGAR